MKDQSTYRIRTTLGDNTPINIPLKLTQEYDSFELLSLKVNTVDNYKTYTSREGIVVGRVSTGNNGLGIPNARVSIFVPRDAYDIPDEESVLYPFSSPTDTNADRQRYNLLPSESDVLCYQVIGSFPSKRRILDNETVCDVFDKFYKYTTVTNEAGDFMLTNIPVGQQRLHVDIDLSDIGPYLSQRPYDMIENLGFSPNRFESNRQFKQSKDLDSLAQVITQNKSVYVYPYWGDSIENSEVMKITRTDLSINYDFQTYAVFMGSVVTDKENNSIRQNCVATDNSGKMSDLITGTGRIEMIRRTPAGNIEQYRVKGDMVIDDNGVWCYPIPMNLDYVRTDEFGNMIPTDDPKRGIPTRARVRFRVTLDTSGDENSAYKRSSYLIPNNPQGDEDNPSFMKEGNADYSFGSDTWDESFVDLFMNKVYTVKNYIPQIQKQGRVFRSSSRQHTGIKTVNHFGDNNPFPYNRLNIKLSFVYRLLCVITKIFIELVGILNGIISVIGALPCWIAEICFLGICPFRGAMKWVPMCIALDNSLCDDGINNNVTYPGCSGCPYKHKTLPECKKKYGDGVNCTNNKDQLFNCVENQLAQTYEATSFNFANDWINGCLYMPVWRRLIKAKRYFLFGLIRLPAKDEWCSSGDSNILDKMRIMSFCVPWRTQGNINSKDFKGQDISFRRYGSNSDCGERCHDDYESVKLDTGVIVNRLNSFEQTVWYYKAVEVSNSGVDFLTANEYLGVDGVAKTIKLLFATDIVLLGSLTDCDTNGVPKFFNYLKASTYNMPTDMVFNDTEKEFRFDSNGKLLPSTDQTLTMASGCDWGNLNEYGEGEADGGLFYSIGCNTIKTTVKSCVNTRRICELGVGLDEMKYIENLAVDVATEDTKIEYNELDYYLRPDGYVSYDELIDFDYRSMFATMNGNRLKTKINKETGFREYDMKYLYMDNFDGDLLAYMSREQRKLKQPNYRFNYKLEDTSTDYLTFRMGDKPYYYDGRSLTPKNAGSSYVGSNNAGPLHFALPKYKNSFYFYFGLKNGKTAIDVFNNKFNAPCLPKPTEETQINYVAVPSGWCAKWFRDCGVDPCARAYLDGVLTIDMSNFKTPYTVMFNSKMNKGVTYTVRTGEEEVNTLITDGKICFFGDAAMRDVTPHGESNMSIPPEIAAGYTRHYLIYENANFAECNCNTEYTYEKTQMLDNGEYQMVVVDANGEIFTQIISMKEEYLKYDNIIRPFKISNNVIRDTYISTEYGCFYPVSKNTSFASEEITVTVSAENYRVPIITRIDKKGNPDDKEKKVDKDVKLNGTITFYNFTQYGNALTKFLIEVEPFDKLTRVDKGELPAKEKIGKEYNLPEYGYYRGDSYYITEEGDYGYEGDKVHCFSGDYLMAICNGPVEGSEEEAKTSHWEHQHCLADDTVEIPSTGYHKGHVCIIGSDGYYYIAGDPDTTYPFAKGDMLIAKTDSVISQGIDNWYINKKRYLDVDLDYEEWWDKAKMLNDTDMGKYNKQAAVAYNGDVMVSNNPCPYFDYHEIEVKQQVGEGEEVLSFLDCYVFKAPKGDVNYQVTITQVCDYVTDKGQPTGYYYKTKNVIQRKYYVKQPTPLKLYINGVDYDIIKRFDTGWTLNPDSSQANPSFKSSNDERTTPYNFNEPKFVNSWLKMTDINNTYYDWDVDKDKYGSGEIAYWDLKIFNYETHMAKEPIEPDRRDYLDENIYNDAYVKWIEDRADWEAEDATFDKKLINIIYNRLDFVKQMKNAFWLTSEDGMDIYYKVDTDEYPYDIWSFYNEEYVSEHDSDKNEAESQPGRGGYRNSWILTTNQHVPRITDIKIPTISAVGDDDFGILNDPMGSQRWDADIYKNSYGNGLCFAQDMVAQYSTTGGISIKPPYYVACVDFETMTKPGGLYGSKDSNGENAVKGFYDKNDDTSPAVMGNDGLEIRHEFPEFQKRRSPLQFFGFHIIDKRFKFDVVAWSYINNIPFYKPYYEYKPSKERKKQYHQCKLTITDDRWSREPYWRDKIFHDAYGGEYAVPTNTIYYDPTDKVAYGQYEGVYVRDYHGYAYKEGIFTRLDKEGEYSGLWYLLKDEDSLINMPGIASGLLLNGSSVSTDAVRYDTEQGYITNSYWSIYQNFQDASINSADSFSLTNVEEDVEDSMPCRRCILYEKYLVDNPYLINPPERKYDRLSPYRSYRVYDFMDHTTQEGKKIVCETAQYVPVRKEYSSMSVLDSDGRLAEYEIYGKMRIVPTTETETDTYEFTLDMPDFYRPLKLAVKLIDGPSDGTTNFYIFNAEDYFTGHGDDKVLKTNFPLNRAVFDSATNSYCFDYSGYNEYVHTSTTAWGKTGNDEEIFNYLTDISKLVNCCDTNCVSKNTETNEETYGYGTSGVFEMHATAYGGNGSWFVVAVTEKGNRCISPVYQFTRLLYHINVTDEGIELTILDILVEIDGVIKAKQYYEAYFDYTVDARFAYDEQVVEEYGIPFEAGTWGPHLIKFSENEEERTAQKKAMDTMAGKTEGHSAGAKDTWAQVYIYNQVGLKRKLFRDKWRTYDENEE